MNFTLKQDTLRVKSIFCSLFLPFLTGLLLSLSSSSVCWAIQDTKSLNQRLLEKQRLKKQLSGIKSKETLCYFVGSFDPIHVGHVRIVEHALAQKTCSYVFVYASGGTFKHKPNRAPQWIRNEMIRASFQEHEQVITSLLPPKDLHQMTRQYQTDSLSLKGIIGEDVAKLLIHANPEQTHFLNDISQVDIHDQNQADILYSNNAFNVTSYVVAHRGKPDTRLSKVPKLLKKSWTSLAMAPNEISSTMVRASIHQNKEFTHLVPPPVHQIITKMSLYQSE